MSNFKDTICIICSRNISDLRTLKITDCLQPSLDPDLTIYQFLQTVSNFKQLDISEVPQNVCEHCQSNISQMYCFQMVCNKSVQNLQRIKETTLREANKQKVNNVMVISYCSDDETPQDINLLFGEDSDNFKDDADLPTYSVKKKKKPKEQIFQEEKIECPECNKFYHRRYMKVHQRTHSGERPHKCELCPKDFVHLSSLIDHRRMHLGQRPFLCTVCGAAFRKSSHLDTHFRQHTGARPYPCEICGKSFATHTRKQEHIQIHSAEAPFACIECPKSFKTSKLLKQHMVTHAKIKPIECTHCGKRFTQKHALRTHQAKSCQGAGDKVKQDLISEEEPFD